MVKRIALKRMEKHINSEQCQLKKLMQRSKKYKISCEEVDMEKLHSLMDQMTVVGKEPDVILAADKEPI